MRKFLLLIFLVAFSQVASAAKLAGAYIEFRWNSNANRYDFILYLYKDCLDNDRMNEFEMIKVRRGAAGAQIDEFRVDKLPGSPLDVGNICPQQQNQSSCRGGAVPSVEKHTYRGSYVLPAPRRASDWIFYWVNTQQPRVDNLNGATASASGPNAIYVESTLNNLDGERSSVSFTTDPVFFVNPGQTSSLNNSAIDEQGSRVGYRQGPIQNGPNSPYTYNAGFNSSNPIGADFWQLNSRGIITLVPGANDITGAYAITASAIENGVVLTSVTRDIAVFNRVDPNIPPTLQDAVGANIHGGDTIVYCFPYSSQTFNIQATNPESSQIVSITAPDDIPRLLPGAIVQTTPGATGSISITWAPESPATIRLLITAKDGSCPREGVTQRTYVILVRNPLQVVLPSVNRVACEEDSKFVPSSVRFGAPPYNYSWRALSGNIVGATDGPTATVQGIGTYTLNVTDRYGCSSVGSSQGRDTTVVVKAFNTGWASSTNQQYSCLNLQVPPGCNYEGCANTQLDFLFFLRFPADVQAQVIPASWQWSFGRTRDLVRGQPENNYLVSGVSSATTSQTTATGIWPGRGIYRVKVCYTARVIFENDTSTCNFCDSMQITIARKPDLLPIRIDSCKGEGYTFYNDASGAITGRFNPPKPQDTLECLPLFGQIYKMNVWRMNYQVLPDGSRVLIDSTNVFTTEPWGMNPPDLQSSCDTIRFRNPQRLNLPAADFNDSRNPPVYRFWIRAENNCGDSLAFYESEMYCRPEFWPQFTPIPRPMTENVTWNRIPLGCPVPVAPLVTEACSPGPYIWRFPGSLNPEDTISGIGYYDRPGEYEITSKDTNGCEFKKTFEILPSVVLTRLRALADCGSPNCYKVNTLIAGNAVGNSAVRVIYNYGDGNIDTVDRDTLNLPNPRFARLLAENTYCYSAPGTYTYKMTIFSISNPNYPEGICKDSISITLFVDEVIPRATIQDTTLCFVTINSLGLPTWEPLTIDAPYTPGVSDWVLYRDIDVDPTYSTSKRFSVNGNGRLIENSPRPGKHRAVLITNLYNGCSKTDTFSYVQARRIRDKVDLAIFTTTSNCYPGNPLTYYLGGDSIQLLGSIVDYRWEFGFPNPVKVIIGKDSNRVTYAFDSDRPQDVNLFVTDSFGCVYKFNYKLEAPDFPPINLTNLLKFNGEKSPICFGDTRRFTIPKTALPPTIGFITWELTGPENFTKSVLFDTTFERTYTKPGNYSLKVTVERQDGDNCKRTAVFDFVVYDEPKADLVINRPCEGNPVILNASGSKSGFATDTIVNYAFSIVSGPSTVPSFSGPDSAVTFALDVVGDYVAKVVITTQNGCVDSTTQTFRVRPRPIASFTYADEGGAPEAQAQSPIVFTSTSTDATSRIRVYDWDFGDGTDTTGARTVKTYQRANIWQVIHRVTNEENCSSADTQLVDLKAYMLFPTAFTPNGDGLNDRFRLITRGLDRVLEYRIYNRWGEEVFNGGTNRAAAWDGTINGSNSPSGVYIIRASGITIYGEQLTVDGRIVLIR